ncbi:hypothetical protein EOD39_6016 [Acipenser ruthenus]|uniref:Uncharacterized protein n=1 Tax=Acipenser ruthenus TaxID=7906 RepID=A0A444UC28_ACIRT|nr:hypothetical protein EOD39_6016 [Acipenser ruthenus]
MNSKTKASAKQQRSTEILSQLTKKPQTNKEDGEVQQLKSKIQELEQENKKLKETVVEAIPVILDKIEELGKRDDSGPTDRSIDSEVNCLCGSPRYAASSAGSTVSISSIPQSQGNGRQLDKVEIHPGSGVYIDQLAWTITNKATSYTSFVRNAMLSVFDIETLVKSNLRGGSGKRQKHGERREALDPNKVNAIYGSEIITRFVLTSIGKVQVQRDGASMCALVKWVNGDDDGKLSVIPTEWIKGFNIEDFEEEGDEDERHYVAEWRRGSKRPREGWQAFDCEVEKVGG